MSEREQIVKKAVELIMENKEIELNSMVVTIDYPFLSSHKLGNWLSAYMRENPTEIGRKVEIHGYRHFTIYFSEVESDE